jgi:hypothetical protein
MAIMAEMAAVQSAEAALAAKPSQAFTAPAEA